MLCNFLSAWGRWAWWTWMPYLKVLEPQNERRPDPCMSLGEESGTNQDILLAFKWTTDELLSTLFHYMCWGHFVTASRIILTNTYRIWTDLLLHEHAFGFWTYFSLEFSFYPSNYSHPKNYSRPKPSSSSLPPPLATVISFSHNFL